MRISDWSSDVCSSDLQGSADRGEVCTDDGEDEQLVPEDVAAVALAVQTAGGDSGVDLDGVGRDGGEQVVGVQVEDQLCVALCVELDAEVPPQSPPRRLVGFEKLGEAAVCAREDRKSTRLNSSH